ERESEIESFGIVLSDAVVRVGVIRRGRIEADAPDLPDVIEAGFRRLLSAGLAARVVRRYVNRRTKFGVLNEVRGAHLKARDTRRLVDDLGVVAAQVERVVEVRDLKRVEPDIVRIPPIDGGWGCEVHLLCRPVLTAETEIPEAALERDIDVVDVATVR